MESPFAENEHPKATNEHPKAYLGCLMIWEHFIVYRFS